MSETTQWERLVDALRTGADVLRTDGKASFGVLDADVLSAAADLLSDGGRPYVQCCDAPHYVIRCLNCMGYQAAPVQHTTEETIHER